MRSVGLKTLKNKLSEYIRLAAGGETVLVTDRDRVVAEIGPPGPAGRPLLSDALLIDAFRQGWMTPPISVGRGPPQRKPVMTIDELLSNLAARSSGPMIYLDSSVALAYLLAEDRFPPDTLWISHWFPAGFSNARFWNRINAHQLKIRMATPCEI